MRYGVVLPGGTAPEQLKLAERAGWDGVFVWEAACGVDAWSLLAAMAAQTSRVRLGTMLTPLPWRRPWAAAAQVAALAQAGATWWLETRWGMPDNMPDRVQDMTERLAAGPPGPWERRRSGTAGRELEGGLGGRELPGRPGAGAAQEPVPE